MPEDLPPLFEQIRTNGPVVEGRFAHVTASRPSCVRC